MSFINIDKKAGVTTAMDALYEDAGFKTHRGIPEFNSRKTVYSVPSIFITQRERDMFYSAYTFGVGMKKYVGDLDEPGDGEIAYRYIDEFIPMTKRIVERAVKDLKHNGMTKEQADKLLAGIYETTGMDNFKDDNGITKTAKNAFIGDIETQVPERTTPTYGYLMFHIIPRLGSPFNLQAIATFQSTERPGVPISGYTCDTKVFDITTTDSTSEIEDQAQDSLYKGTYFGERCIKQTWPEKDDAIFTKLFGCLCESCRKEVFEMNRDREKAKRWNPCFFGNEFLDPADRFCFDTERMNLLCRWLFYPQFRTLALKNKPKT